MAVGWTVSKSYLRTDGVATVGAANATAAIIHTAGGRVQCARWLPIQSEIDGAQGSELIVGGRAHSPLDDLAQPRAALAAFSVKAKVGQHVSSGEKDAET